MKKFMIIIVVALFATNCFAQSKLSLNAGFMTKNTKSDGHKSSLIGDKGSTNAFLIGLTRVWDIKAGFGIETGANFEFAFDKAGESSMFDINLSVPVRVQYLYEVNSDFGVFAYTGPSIDFDIMAKSKYDNGSTTESTINWFGGENSSGFNMLWCIGAGIQYKSVKLRMGTELGLVNTMKNADYKVTVNKPFAVVLSFML